MCDKCDGKIMLMIGEVKGIVEGIQIKQSEIHETVTDNRVAAQQDLKDLSKDITKIKVRFAGVGALFGAISGFLARYIPS